MMTLPQATLGHLLASAAAQYRDKTALICGQQRISFHELNRCATSLASGLAGLGIGRGDRVTLYSHNCWQWVVSYYALARIGAVVNPINTLMTAEEVRFIVSDCGAKAIIAPAEKAVMLMDLGRETALERVIIFGDPLPPGVSAFGELLSARTSTDAPIVAESEDLSTIMYTSGTTGHPKGAMLTHKNLSLNAALTATMHVRTATDTTVTGMPLCHVYGSVILNSSMASGATLVLLERFNEVAALKAIAEYRATMFEGVPTMLMYVLNCAELDRHDLSSVTRCTTGGQTMPVAKMQEIEERFACPLLEVWGMTEIAGVGTTHPLYSPNHLGSIGVPLPGVECRIADATDGIGELMIHGPIVMRGYYRNDAATRETIEPDGWLHSGDLARMDADGYIHIIDRKKDMINTAGYKIYPAEIERVLAMHPAVAMVAVGSQPDANKGEVPRAYVVVKRDMIVDEVTLLSFCRERLAVYKVPRSIRFVPDVPKTSTGKILGRQLQTLDSA